MAARKRTSQANECWISESRNFSVNVMKDTFASLRDNETFELSRNEQNQLEKLEKLWLINYKPMEHLPESNPCPLPLLKRASQKRRANETTKPTAAATTKKFQGKKKGDEETSVDARTLDDNVDIVYRIQIPRLRSHWSLRSFDLKIKAFVCKNNLIEPLINWELLDSIMELPLEEATALFQSRVDEMLQAA